MELYNVGTCTGTRPFFDVGDAVYILHMHLQPPSHVSHAAVASSKNICFVPLGSLP